MAYIKNDGWQQQRQAHQEMPQKGLWPVFRSLKIRCVLLYSIYKLDFTNFYESQFAFFSVNTYFSQIH